ncbi:hypothetical protein PN441_08040 [Spirulina major CS-329]|uniref:hypothetical protein n=1 Tax=Spirulina TaxID=1154 RepID=UPI00232D34C2|nr:MULTISPECIES: hypothetical protein [Spirulina]MDB9496579.1 hypothetical protein [Spirulina subsalsa CS-330]MDB9503021.1 hypothetical protein [Spirulina major CS-329]
MFCNIVQAIIPSKIADLPRNYQRIVRISKTVISSALFSIVGIIPQPPQAWSAIPHQAAIDQMLAGNSADLRVRGIQEGIINPGETRLQSHRDSLLVVEENSLARVILRFLDESGDDLASYIKTNPHTNKTIYYYPCTNLSGDMFIGHVALDRDNRERACDQGVEVQRGRHPNSSQLDVEWQRIAAQFGSKTLQAQAPPRRIYYCMTAGESGAMGFATGSDRTDPCPPALTQCEASGDTTCQPMTMGVWWSSDEDLAATLTCPDQDTVVVTGTGETIAAAAIDLIPSQAPQACVGRVLKPSSLVVKPASDDAVLAAGDQQILVQVRDTPDGIQADVIEGAITVEAVNLPQGQVVSKGERYIHTSEGGRTERFDRAATLKSVDLEVLCAFSAVPNANLTIETCYEANLLGNGQEPIGFCNQEQDSGGRGVRENELQMSTNAGEIRIEYNMYDIPDRLQVFYEGEEILDTGFISGSGQLRIPFSGQSGRVTVRATGAVEEFGTRWNYKLRCPR